MKTLCAAVIAVACVSGVLAAQQKDDSVPYRAADLVQHWHLIVNQVFEDMRAFTSDEFVDEVLELEDQFLAGGGVRAAQDHATADQLKKADDTVKRFAVAMVKAGERLNGVTRVPEDSVHAAIKSVCPQYPFCE